MIHKFNLTVISCVIIATLAGCASAGQGLDGLPLLEREAQRVGYLTEGEYDRLQDIFSPSLSYIHSSGLVDSKESLLLDLRSGRIVYHRMDHQDVDVRFAGRNVAILTGASDLVVTLDREEMLVPLRFTIVYVKERDEWLLEAWHSVRR